MSHFTVLVVTDTPGEEELSAVLQPYHEYECTGVNDQYVVFVDHHDEVMAEWKTDTRKAYRAPDGTVYDGYEDIFYREFTPEEEEKVGHPIIGTGFGAGVSYHSKDWGDGRGYRAKVRFTPREFEEFEQPVSQKYKTVEEYAKDWHGHDAILGGRIGRYTNPDSKWDWWKVGGRWSGLLLLKSGDTADRALKRDIDFTSKQDEAQAEAEAEYDRAARVIAGRPWETWEQVRTRMDNIDKAREFYREQDVIRDLNAEFDSFWMEFDPFSMSREAFVSMRRRRAIQTFALLDNDGWHERGEMGFFACVSNENEGWPDEFERLLAAVPDDKYLTVVDCHV